MLTHQERSLLLVVEDDGSGFDVATASRRAELPGGLGLMGMQERATLLGGTLTVESRLGAGTTIAVAIPLATEVACAEDSHPAG
jgi:signal transduction histidine kinase